MHTLCEHEGLDELLERHRAFWHRVPVDQPLLTVEPWEEYVFYEPFPLVDGSVATDRTELKPGLLDARVYLERVRPSEVIDGDFIQSWVAYDVCWMEAILGCLPVAESGTTWAEPFMTDWSQVASAMDKEPSPWLGELVEVHQVLGSMADGVWPVGQPLMRGPSDMALAAMSSEMFCEGFYQHSEELRALLEYCTKLWLEVANHRLEVTPTFHGGYCGRDVWGLWAPGPLLDCQEDATGLLSPKTYRDYIAPLDQKMARQFDYSIIHLHSGQLQMLPVMLEIPELTAVQIVIDPPPYGPPAGALVSKFRAVQDAGKSLLVTGPVTQSELDVVLAELSPVGLALRVALLPDGSAE